MLRIMTAVNKKCSAGLDLWGFLYDIHPNFNAFAVRATFPLKKARTASFSHNLT